MTIEEMKARKIELGFTNEMIAELSGVPLSTVQKVFSGATRAPRRLTLEAIQRVLRSTAYGTEGTGTAAGGFLKDSGTGGASRESRTAASPVDRAAESIENKSAAEGGILRDAGAAYAAEKKDVLYTIDDYYALPEDQRVELIDGVFYDMGAPAVIHQKILGDLYILFRECTDNHDMPCEVFLAPCDVRLDMDRYTMVQPDLLVICGGYDIHAIRHEGAPDLVVEILSPSTRSKDQVLKLHKYQSAGVREYWIIDPRFRTVTVHFFEDEDYHPVQYDFNEKIPVSISGGECSIDFSRILRGISSYYE